MSRNLKQSTSVHILIYLACIYFLFFPFWFGCPWIVSSGLF